MKNQNLIIACPKGRLEEKVVKFLFDRGLSIEEAFFNDSVRKLTFDTNLNEIKVIKLKPSDIRSYIMLGAADIGFVGYDEILENSSENISINAFKLAMVNFDVAMFDTKYKILLENNGFEFVFFNFFYS